MKLLGNAAYGKTMTSKAKHVGTYVCSDKTSQLVNETQLKKVTEIADDIYEVEMTKKTVRWDLPLKIGFLVY